MKQTIQTYAKKHGRILLAILTLAIIGGIIAIVYIKQTSVKTITGYQDQSGNVYECSRPVEAGDYGYYGFGSEPDYQPADPSEAAKYCRPIGLE